MQSAFIATPAAAATLTRASVATKQDGSQVAVNAPRYELGRAGLAIMIEEGTTNLVSYPTDLSNAVWTKSNGSVSQEGAWWRFTESTATASHNVRRDLNIPCAENTQYTWSVRVKKGDHRYVRLRAATNIGFLIDVVADLNSGTLVTPAAGKSITALGDGSYRVTVLGTTPAGATTTYLGLIHRDDANSANEVYTGNGTSYTYFAEPQIEAKPYVTSFIDGSRVADILYVPTAGLVSPAQGTIAIWVYVNDLVKRQGGTVLTRIFDALRLDGQPGLRLVHDNDNLNWVLDTFDDAGAGTSVGTSSSATANGWHHFAVTWSAAQLSLYLDGTLGNSAANPKLPGAFADKLRLGHASDTGVSGSQLNSLLQGLRIYSRALTAAEVLAAYQGG